MSYSFLEDDWDGMFTQLEQAKMMSAINNPVRKAKGKSSYNSLRMRSNHQRMIDRDYERNDQTDYKYYKDDEWFSKVADWAGIQDFDSSNDMRGMLKKMQDAGIKGSNSGPARRTDEEFNAAVKAAMDAQKAEAKSLEPTRLAGAEGYQTGMEGWIASLMGMLGGGVAGTQSANRFAGYHDDSNGPSASSFVQQPSSGWSPRGGW